MPSNRRRHDGGKTTEKKSAQQEEVMSVEYNGIKLCVVRTPVSHTHKLALNMPALGMARGFWERMSSLDFAPDQEVLW